MVIFLAAVTMAFSGCVNIQNIINNPAPTTAPVVVTVHDKKKREPRVPMSEGAKRTLIIIAAVLVTLGLAAAGYLLFA